MSYTKTTWRNNQAPAINADNLNHMEQGIESAHSQIDVNTSNIESLTTQVQNNATNIASEISARQSADSLLQSQIDQIIAPTGEAPSAAEVENARIGDDDVTYDTLGNAIRGQFSDLKDDIANNCDVNNESFIAEGVVTIPLQFTNGRVISKITGAISTISGTTFAATEDFIAIPIGAIELDTTAFMGGSSDYGYAFYTFDKGYISGGQTFKGVSIPNNARYVRITDYNANSNHTDKTLTVTTMVDDIYDKISLLNTEINLIENSEFLFYPSFIKQKAINVSNGSEASFPGYNTWASSEFISIPENVTKIVSNAISGSNDYGYAFYDSNKDFIANSSAGYYSGFGVDVQSNYKYFRFTSYKSDSDHSTVYLGFFDANDGIVKINETLDYFAKGVITKSNIPMTNEGAITSEGTVASLPGYPNYRYSDFIAIPSYTAKLSLNTTATGVSIGLAFYDEAKIFIAGSSVTNYNAPTVDVEKEYKYIRFTDARANEPEAHITFTSELSISSIYSNAESFADAVASNKLLKGTYTLDEVVTLDEGQTVIGNGCIVNVTDSGQIIMNNGCKITGIKFVGTWNPTREEGDGITYTRYGYVPLITYQNLYDGDSDALFGVGKDDTDAVINIPYDNAYNTIVDGCRFENFDRLVVRGGGRRHQEKTNPIICNNYFSDCRMGVAIYGEFIRCYANEYLRCIVGCYLRGANSNNFGEIFKCCDVGYYFPINAVAHNEITSVETAHCGLAGIYLRYLDSSLGCIVNGCHFPDAPIIGVDVNNLYITGCIISTYLKYDSGQHNAITCCNIRRDYLYGLEQFQVPSDTLITLNRAMGNASDSEVNWT